MGKSQNVRLDSEKHPDGVSEQLCSRNFMRSGFLTSFLVSPWLKIPHKLLPFQCFDPSLFSSTSTQVLLQGLLLIRMITSSNGNNSSINLHVVDPVLRSTSIAFHVHWVTQNCPRLSTAHLHNCFSCCMGLWAREIGLGRDTFQSHYF